MLMKLFCKVGFHFYEEVKVRVTDYSGKPDKRSVMLICKYCKKSKG